jgi:hypothetical protein
MSKKLNITIYKTVILPVEGGTQTEGFWEQSVKGDKDKGKEVVPVV